MSKFRAKVKFTGKVVRIDRREGRKSIYAHVHAVNGSKEPVEFICAVSSSEHIEYLAMAMIDRCPVTFSGVCRSLKAFEQRRVSVSNIKI